MATGVGRGLLATVLLINFLATCVELGIAGWAINNYINQVGRSSSLGGPRVLGAVGGNAATPFFVIVVLISGVVGMAAIFAATQHLWAWRRYSQAAALATSLIDLLLSFLALGLAVKQLHIGLKYSEGRDKRLQTLASFAIILAALKILQVLFINSGIFGEKYGPRFRDEAPGTGPVEPRKERAAPVV